MVNETPHWTSENTEAFIHRITFDFITTIAKHLEAKPLTQAKLAKKLDVSEGAVSQVLNTPRNLTLKTIVRYARAIGLKIALVAYDDGDPDNKRGPINSEIFAACWESVGRPEDFRQLRTMTAISLASAESGFQRGYLMPDGRYVPTEPEVATSSGITEDIRSDTFETSDTTSDALVFLGGQR